eukprot:m.84835 g.84835  ORF g.84835 m.84835 type:complete len:920 (+) comp13490_c0_seq2:21-2780(+)
MDVSAVERALACFYDDPDPANKRTAQDWLATLRGQPGAWDLGWQLLDPSRAVPVQFFGANLILGKITTGWAELGPEDQVTLKDRLLNRIVVALNGERVMLTRCCILLAALCLQAVPATWANVIPSVLSYFQSLAPTLGPLAIRGLLEFLTVLPEEYRTATLSAERKKAIFSELFEGKDQVLTLLLTLITNPHDTEQAQPALRCLASWVEIDANLLTLTEHVSAAFRCLHNPQLFDNSVDTLVSIFSNPDGSKYPGVVRAFAAQVASLAPFLTAAIEAADDSTVRSVARIALALVETHMHVFLKPASPMDHAAVQAVLKMLLDVTRHPGQYPLDETVSALPIAFWQTFFDEISSADIEHFEELKRAYGAAMLPLLDAFHCKVQYPPSSVVLDAESSELFHAYRSDIGDDILYMCGVGKEQVLSRLHTQLMSSLATPDRWQPIEASLFCIRSLGASIEYDENTFAPQILTAVTQAPQHPTVLRSALLMIGAFADYLSRHGDILLHLLPFIFQSLPVPGLAAAAAVALRDVCSECAEVLLPHRTSMTDSCLQFIAAGTLMPRERARVVEALGSVLSAATAADVQNDVERILGPSVQTLARLTELPDARTEILNELAVLAAACKYFDPATPEDVGHPVATVVAAAWPALRRLLVTHSADDAVVVLLCECMARALRTAGDHIVPVLPSMLADLCDAFLHSPKPQFIEVYMQAVVISTARADLEPLVVSLLGTMLTAIFTLFQTQFTERPDVVQSFFKLMHKTFRALPHYVGSQPALQASFMSVALAAFQLREGPSVDCAARALALFIEKSAENAPMQGLLTSQGPALTRALLVAISGGQPRSLLPPLVDVLFALNKEFGEHLRDWLTELLAQPGFPTVKATEAAKHHFITRVARERAHKKQLSAVVKEFSIHCRGLEGTAFGAL